MVNRLCSHIFITFVVILSTLFSATAAEDVSFTTSAPMTVAVGETFRVEFALNASPVKDSFTAPQFPGFDVLAGPAVSQGSSVQIVNGKMTRSVNISYTYVLVAQEAGNFTIGRASVRVDKATHSTKPLPIEVVEESRQRASASSQQSASASGDINPEGRIAKDDILIRTIVSRTSLYQGEPLRATIKLYSRVGIAGADSEKMPSFNGFWAQEIQNSGGRQTQRETYNGKVYETQVLRDYILFPQRSGELTISPAQMDIIAQVIVQSHNIDPFFGRGHEAYNVRRHVSSPEIKIDVKPLPAGAPASFMGAVGHFEVSQTAPKNDLAANSASTLKIKVEGEGNLSFVQALSVNFPESFEYYNVKTTESITLTTAGGRGYREFEYPFIPRSEGEYTIPPTEFSYFDPTTGEYVVRQTPSVVIGVTSDKSGTSTPTAGGTLQRALSREDVKMLGRDIRFIKIENSGFSKHKRAFIFSPLYFIILSVLLLLAVVSYIFVSGQIKDSENVIATKGKRANKVAVQRFKEAKRYMSESNERAFYEEMLRCLWGYMSDKFNIPVANLTRESVREELHKRGVNSGEIKSFSQIISSCDEAQYSPLAAAHMGEIYAQALKLISSIETQVKR